MAETTSGRPPLPRRGRCALQCTATQCDAECNLCNAARWAAQRGGRRSAMGGAARWAAQRGGRRSAEGGALRVQVALCPMGGGGQGIPSRKAERRERAGRTDPRGKTITNMRGPPPPLAGGKTLSAGEAGGGARG